MIDTNNPNDLFDDVNDDFYDDEPVKETKKTFENKNFSLKNEDYKVNDDELEDPFEEKEEPNMWNELFEKTMETSDELAGKAFDFLKKTGEKAAEVGTDLFEKTKEKASALEEKLRLEDEAFNEKMKNPKHKITDSLLEGTDSFFEKAKRFADSGIKKTGLFDTKDGVEIRETETPKTNDKGGTVTGFEDLDGDGDALIDDAIIES